MGTSAPSKLTPGNWLTPVLAGGYALMATMIGMGFLGKGRKKMTKLERACIAFVVAVGEKVEELEKRNNHLQTTLDESDRKLSDQSLRADRAEAELEDARGRLAEKDRLLEVAYDQIRKAEARVEELSARPARSRSR